ncbi:AraC family transcriptional regulator [Negadavirga shengliensis]|uniref:Helix-turn-helix domain-containing protein n=1 Tax=Negadavirga shengliensis TaxID=1389218 RepID=A0ABV9T908_9BACT
MPDEFDYFRFDFFTAIILTGVAQGIFLFVLLIPKPHKQPFHFLILALFSLSCSLILLEIFLGYSGLMARTLILVDFSEPLVFAIGPLVFLLIRSMGGKVYSKREFLHFIPFVFYVFYHLPFLLENEAVKFNSFLNAFYPHQSLIEAVYQFPVDPFHIRRNLDYLIFFHLGFYLILSFLLQRKLKESGQSNPYFLSWTKVLIGFFAVVVTLYLLVRASFQNDLGDHLLGSFLTLMLYFVSYKMLTDSGFFQPLVQLKYEKSSLSEDSKQVILNKLKVLEGTKFYVQPSMSLGTLAKQLNTTPHYLSQVLNEAVGKTFFEYMGQLRIEEAKRILADPSTVHLKIEEIAEMSGYLSKSAFNAAFKKNAGTTPGEYRKSAGHLGAGL